MPEYIIQNNKSMHLLRVNNITNCVYIFKEFEDLLDYVFQNKIYYFSVENVSISLDNIKELYNEIYEE